MLSIWRMGWIYNRKEWVFARGETPVSVKLHDFGIFFFSSHLPTSRTTDSFDLSAYSTVIETSLMEHAN